MVGGNTRDLEDNWRIQKGNKEPHCPEGQYWKKYIRLEDEEKTVDSLSLLRQSYIRQRQPSDTNVSGNVLSPKFISSLRARPSHNESLLLFVISIFEPLKTKHIRPKPVILQIKMNKPIEKSYLICYTRMHSPVR